MAVLAAAAVFEGNVDGHFISSSLNLSHAQKRLSSCSCWKLLISSIFFAVWAGGQYLFRNLVLRTSQVVIEPDGWFLSHLLAAPKTSRKITINGSDTAGYDKSKVKCFNCHKMGHFAKECRGPRNQDSRNMNQDSSRRTVNVEKTSSKAMVAMDGADSEVHNDKTCSKTYLKCFETLKTQLDDLRIEFNKSEFNLATYKRGLASVEEQLVFYKKNEVIFCEQLAVLKRDISYKDSELSMLKSELEKLKQEKESNKHKIENFDNASKSLDKLIGSQITDKSRRVWEEFQQPEFEGYIPKSSKNVSKDISNEVRESLDGLLVEELVLDDKLEKKIIFPTVTKLEFVRPKQQEKLVRKPINFDHVQAHYNYHQKERVVSRNSYTRVNYNYSAKKAHPIAHKNMVPRAVLMKIGLRSLNTARPVNTAYRKTIGIYPISQTSRNLMEDMLPLGDELKKGKLLVKELLKLMCDKKNNVLFTDTGCFILSPDFKLADESQVLLKVPRKNNVYSVDMNEYYNATLEATHADFVGDEKEVDTRNKKDAKEGTPPPIHARHPSPFFNSNLIGWNWDDVYIVISNDEEEDIPTPTVETQVQVICRKRVYSLVDESESDEE
ncbi:ribonuclease H-like domain-containing protein [Tanacetum coccineum]